MTFKMKKIKDLCDISSGKRPELISKIKSNQTPVPIVGSGGVSGYTSKANCTKPTLVTGRVGTLGLLFCFENFWASDNTLLLHPKEQSEFLYIKYGLSGVIGTLISANRGAANPLITQKDVQDLEIPWPEKKVRDSFASILSTIDSRIENLKSTNETLENMAQALFKSWFVDFDPVKAKSRGEKPFGMSDAIAELFPSEFEQTEEGLIPEGWKTTSMDVFFNIQMGISPKGSNISSEKIGLPFYQGCKNFGIKYPLRAAYTNTPLRTANENDILFSVRAPVGAINIATELCVIGRGLASISCKTKTPVFAWLMINSLKDKFEMFNQEGTIYGAISGKDLKAIELLVPPVELIEKFEHTISNAIHIQKKFFNEITTLNKLKISLLTNLMNVDA